MKNIFFLAILFLFVSCLEKNKVPSEIIRPKEMQSILWDVIRAQTLSSQLVRKDSAINQIAETKALTQKVFQIHNIKASDFERSYAWYTNHPDIIKVIFDSISSQNQRESQIQFKERVKPFQKKLLKNIE